MNIQLCRSCNAEMYMLKHVDTGKFNPINARPEPNGNIMLDLGLGTYRILTGLERTAAMESGADLHTSHFSNCKFAKTHRS